MTKPKTNQQILEIARDLLADGGLAAVSFDAIARRLQRSKQAVLYWYPTKHDLLAAMYVPCLKTEAETATAAVASATTSTQAISAFVEAVAHFHLEDLDRFRMMYLAPQVTGGSPSSRDSLHVVQQIHPLSDKLYSALARHLTPDRDSARRQAVAIHAAVLGLVLMVALTQALNDPMKHTAKDLIAALVASLTGHQTPS